MASEVVIRGNVEDPSRIDLDEPLAEMRGPVEVTVRSLAGQEPLKRRDVFELIASLKPGKRSKADIDQQIAEERASWGDR